MHEYLLTVPAGPNFEVLEVLDCPESGGAPCSTSEDGRESLRPARVATTEIVAARVHYGPDSSTRVNVGRIVDMRAGRIAKRAFVRLRLRKRGDCVAIIDPTNVGTRHFGAAKELVTT